MRRHAVRTVPLLLLLLLIHGVLCYQTAVAAERGNAGGAEGAKPSADFVDPTGSARESEFVDPNPSEPEFHSATVQPPALASQQPSKPSVVDTVVSSVEQPTNVSYDNATEEAIDVVAGETKGTEETKAAQAAPPAPPVDEKGPYELVKAGATQGAGAGALGYFKGKALVETSFAQAVRRALEKNLTIKFSERNYERSDSTVTRAKSVKDPVFSVVANGTQADTYERREYLVRRRFVGSGLQNEIQGAFGTFADDQQAAPPQSAIVNDDVITAFPSVEGFTKRGAFDRAGFRSMSRAETITAGYTHQLPWGSLFGFNISSKHNFMHFQESATEDSIGVTPRYFEASESDKAAQYPNIYNALPRLVLPPGFTDPNDPTKGLHAVFYESKTRSTYRDFRQRAWSSNMAVRLTVPVPYTKDWGPNGPAEYPIKAAKVSQERAYWQLQSDINSTLYSVNSVYWEVVRAMRRLDAITNNRRSLEEVFKQTEDLLKQNRVTDYDLAQAKMSLSNVQRSEQGAWAAYVRASNALKNLLDYEKEAVLLPVNYGGDLAGGVTFKSAEVMAIAMENNPDLQVTRADRQYALVTLKFAHNQVRPDLKMSAGMTWSQSDAVYGYQHVYTSWASLGSPDRRDGYAALTFRMPWGNRPAEDRLDESEQRFKQAEKSLASQANSVARNVNDAVAVLASAREQTALALKSLQIAEQVYKSILELWTAGRVPELAAGKSTPAFTLLAKNDAVLNARLVYVDAQVALKQAEGRLLAAQGLIAARYAEDLKIEVKPVVEPGKAEEQKEQAAKKEEPAKEPAK